MLVSEVMLQQTQVARVARAYPAFMAAFPTMPALAAAPAGDVLRAWAGMGYNGRAVRLHRLARLVTQDCEGTLPDTVEALQGLPGVGPYTAAAVACFAFGVHVPVLDTNVARVLSRVAHGVTPPARGELEQTAERWLPGPPRTSTGLRASTWHQALMDIGATLCTVARPRCMLCPVRHACLAAPALQGGVPRAVAAATAPRRPRQGTFAGSTRQVRGRIVTVLREVPAGRAITLRQLAERLRRRHALVVAQARLRTVVAALARDGLVRQEPAEDPHASSRVSLA